MIHVQVSEHSSYIPSEDPTNQPEPTPPPLPVYPPKIEDEEQNFFTKHIYVSTGRRKRAKQALIAFWDNLFDTDEEKAEKAQAKERAILEAWAQSLVAQEEKDPEDPVPRDDDDLEFRLNSWYPMVLVMGAAAMMLNGKM